MNIQEDGCTRLGEVAVLFHLRDVFRSGDVWLRRSRRYADLKQAVVPIQAAQASARLVVPFDPEEWLVDRRNRMDIGLKRLAKATRDGAIPSRSIENGLLHIDRLTAKPKDNVIHIVAGALLDYTSELEALPVQSRDFH